MFRCLCLLLFELFSLLSSGPNLSSSLFSLRGRTFSAPPRHVSLFCAGAVRSGCDADAAVAAAAAAPPPPLACAAAPAAAAAAAAPWCCCYICSYGCVWCPCLHASSSSLVSTAPLMDLATGVTITSARDIFKHPGSSALLWLHVSLPTNSSLLPFSQASLFLAVAVASAALVAAFD